MALSIIRGNRASFNPVYGNKRSSISLGSGSPNDYLDQLDYDDDDDDNESLAESNADSVITDPSSDPSKFRLEISIFEEENSHDDPKVKTSGDLVKPEANDDSDLATSKSNEQGSTSAPPSFASDTTKHLKKDSLALSNETLWDIFDLVFECENYKNTLTPESDASESPSSSFKRSKAVFTPRFRDEMKHKYNLVRNATFDKCNTKFESIFETGPCENSSYLVSTLVPSLSRASIDTFEKKDTSTLVSWLASQVNTQLNSFWESVDGEILEQKETGRSNLKYNSYNKTFFTTLHKEIEFISSINRDMTERKKLMDGIVVDLASLVSISSGAKPNSPESPMATMGPLLAAKMVSDTLPVTRISKFIPYLARFTYAQNLVYINEIIVNEIKDIITESFTLNPTEEKALGQAQDFESILSVFRPKHAPISFSLSFTSSQSDGLPKTPQTSSPDDPKDNKSESHEKQTKPEHEFYGSHVGLSSSPPQFSGSSAVARHSVSFFPNNHRRTASTSSVSSLVSGNSTTSVPNGQFPLGTGSAAAAAAAASSSGSRPPSTPLPLSLFPAAGISSSHHSSSSTPSLTTAALSLVSSADFASSPGTPITPVVEAEIDEKKLVGPLLAPLLALNVISPNLETLYPDYLSFLHTVFSSWTNISNSTGSAGTPIGFNAFSGAMSPPATRQSFSIPESVKMQTALGGIYLTLINHGTTRKVPAIAKCFSIMQHQIQTQPNSRLQVRDLDALKSKLVEVYNEWVALQPPPDIVPLSRRSSSVVNAVDAAKVAGKSSPNQKATATRVEKPNLVAKTGSSATGEPPLPVSADAPLPTSANKTKHKHNQSTCSTTSDSTKNAAPTPSLPTPCPKCFHNHKGNNCARKCYVCRMAKLAAQHGHIVELKTGPPSATASPTTATAPALNALAVSNNGPSNNSTANSTQTVNNNHAANAGYNKNLGNGNGYHNANGGVSRTNSVSGGVIRNNSVKNRNGNFNNRNNNVNPNTNNINHNNNHNNTNYNNNGQRTGHNRAQSYSVNGYPNNNHRRTQSYSYQNGNSFQPMTNMTGINTFHTGMNTVHYNHNGGNMGYVNNSTPVNYVNPGNLNNNGANGNTNHTIGGGQNNNANGNNNNNNINRNGHRRNQSNSPRFTVRVGQQYQGN